jgi:glutamate 5-kinase
MTFQVDKKKGLDLRKSHLGKTKRMVVKVGSAVLTDENGLNQQVMKNLAQEVSFLVKSGIEVIIVSSGAVAAGRKRLGLQIDKKLGLKEKQGAAAVGQSSLMRAYEDWNIVPIINENDTVSVEELRFGDNDTLGALITNLIEADLFVCLTDVDGLYTGNPNEDFEAKPVHTVARVDKKVKAMAGNVVGALGAGGMQSKIQAAHMVSARGGSSFIGFACEAVGTFFLPQAEKMQSRKHWIAYVLRPKGYLVLDRGACKALVKGGKSLLPSGILEVRGNFKVGASVQCLDEKGKAIATGLSNYSADDLNKIKGINSVQIEKALGYKDSDEVIHRDNLVVL